MFAIIIDNNHTKKKSNRLTSDVDRKLR